MAEKNIKAKKDGQTKGSKLSFGGEVAESNFQGYVKGGVEDKSKAIGITNDADLIAKGAQLTIDTYKKYDKEQALGGAAEGVNVIRDDQIERSYGNQAEMTKQLEAEQKTISEKTASGMPGDYSDFAEETRKNSEGLMQALNEKTTKLHNSREQGVMDAAELKSRLAKVTREAIANNPAYANEIMGHVQSVANVNNLSGRVARDAALDKADKDGEDDLRKEIFKAAHRMEIDFAGNPAYQLEDGSPNLELIASETSKRQLLKRGSEDLKRGDVDGNYEDNMTVKDAEKLTSKGGLSFLSDVTLTGLTTDIQEINNGKGSAGEKAELRIALGNEWKKRAANYRMKYKLSPTNERVKFHAAQLDKQIDGLLKVYTDSDNGTIDAAKAKARLDGMLDTKKLEILGEPSVAKAYAKADLMKEFSHGPTGAAGRVLAEKGFNEAMRLHEEKVDKGLNESPAKVEDEYNTNVNEGFGELGKGRGTIMSQIAEKYVATAADDPESALLLKRNLSSTIAYIRLDTGDNTKRAQELQHLIKNMSKEGFMKAMPALSEDPKVVSKLTSLLTDYKKNLAVGVQNFMTKFPEADLQLNPDTGHVMIANPKKEYEKFEDGGLKSLNESFKAYNNIHGRKSSSTVDEFYEGIINRKEPEPKKAVSL
jgi:hypothetical protein